MRRLVESWNAAERELHGNTLAAAIEDLNQTLQMRVSRARVSEWRRGVNHPSTSVVSQLLWRTMPWALGEAGAPPGALESIRAHLWRIEMRDGEEWYDLL